MSAAAPADSRATAETYWETVGRLASAQKGASRTAPAYSRFVNRKLGRLLAAWAYRAGLSPNAVTAISAACTGVALLLLLVLEPSFLLGVAVAALLVLGYAFDSADGQVARLQGGGTPAGEWLDHIVDAIKTAALPIAVFACLQRTDLPDTWLAVPLVYAVVASATFFGMILTEQLRKQNGRSGITASSGGAKDLIRGLLVLPMDYGVLCLSFLLLGAPGLFLALFSLLTVGSFLFLCLALRKWFREISGFTTSPSGAISSASRK
jgi:phosphatidylglycerophosphate synthase